MKKIKKDEKRQNDTEQKKINFKLIKGPYIRIFLHKIIAFSLVLIRYLEDYYN